MAGFRRATESELTMRRPVKPEKWFLAPKQMPTRSDGDDVGDVLIWHNNDPMLNGTTRFVYWHTVRTMAARVPVYWKHAPVGPFGHVTSSKEKRKKMRILQKTCRCKLYEPFRNESETGYRCVECGRVLELTRIWVAESLGVDASRIVSAKDRMRELQ